MYWVISAVFLLLGGLVQAIQAIREYRSAFTASLDADAALRQRQLNDVSSDVEDRIDEERARAAALESLGADAEGTIEEALSELSKLTLGRVPSSLKEFAEQHAEQIKLRQEELVAEFAGVHQPMKRRAARLAERANRAQEETEGFLRGLAARAHDYKRRRRWLLAGWLLIFVGSVFNLVAALQAL